MEKSKIKTILVLGVNADIGFNIASFFKNDGYNVIGTYIILDRKKKKNLEELKINLIKLDVTNQKSQINFIKVIKKKKIKWDVFFSSVGTSLPISRFFSSSFTKWENSININFIGQLKALHSIYPFKRENKTCSIVFLAGGGTNNPMRCYSAYCVSKIALIKMCELIDDEYLDLKPFIIGPGFVKTKTHYETLNAGLKAEKNFKRVKEFMESKSQGTKFEDIYKCIRWGMSKSKKVISGRNFSVVHDDWNSKSLELSLKNDTNMYKLRRYKN